MKFSAISKALLIGCGLFAPSFAFSATSLNVEKLAHDPYWLKLGHYIPSTFTGYKGTVDSEEFYLSAQGASSPQQELQATIDVLYSEDATLAEQKRCEYPARYSWLQSKLGKQAELNCPELETWREVLDPEGMTLVFPTAFMNNPSSMFGHTLLRIDAKDQTRHKELVAFAINFAAEPETQDNAALYAIKGLVGSYPGRFTVMPYYRKVREYNDIESRDIWEYKLKLNEKEVERILLHLWEMQRAKFDYYFLDENCSYQLLALLELARDDLQLIDQFPLHAIPSDTVEVLNSAQLLERPAYRESFGTRLLHQANEIDPELFEAAIQAKQGKFPTSEQYSEQERAAILEFAYEWLNFELYDVGLERDPTAKRLTELLYQRSRIKVDSPFSEVPTPEVSPEKGHASARTGLSYQYSDQLGVMMTFEGRIAYHDLLDSQQGFIPGAKISFLDTQLSVDEQGTSRFDRFYLIDAMALAPSNRVFDSLAWNARIGFDRMPNDGKLESRWFGQGGYGKAWGDAQSLHFYGLLSGEVSGGELTDYDATLGGGIEAGVVYQLAENHRIGIQGQYLALLDSDADQNAKASANWHWQLDRNMALRSEVSYLHWGHEELSGKLTAYIYF
ncbi:DUF4105 domain-containing protein [Vibrio sp. 404]|uniref:DUF4105 domain-containing protein n=1 Tax=Vibrio marinisediminis TaxID=2758441 RepID=A0A7W2FR28_9VIBR|nr:DUF4105 domain-containing protein [Vibrio marinisediminis]MBA5762634.1 DUF4105 domain-containing protein [Vibrio marinisediminis]